MVWLVALVLSHAALVHADPTPRRRLANRVTLAGAVVLLSAAAAEGTAAGLGDHPGPQQGFAITGGVLAGAGAVTLGVGLLLRATSPDDAPDAISLDPTRRRHRWERRVGASLAGLGALAATIGVIHAIGAAHDDGLADAQCPGGLCNADGARLQRRAETLRLAAQLLIGPGLVAMTGGIVMYRSAPDQTVELVPVLAPDHAGAAIVGRF
jgi:hypothetical protein